MRWRDFFDRCAEAGGPVHLGDTARAAGLTPRSVRGRAEREGWWRPFPGVVAPPGTPVDARSWALAATIYAGGRTGDPARDLVAVGRWSALALLGQLRSAPTAVEVVVPACRDVASNERLNVVRSRLLRPEDISTHEGVPLLTGPALVRDLAAVATGARLRSVIVDLVQRDLLRLESLDHLLRRCPTFPGRVRLRRALADLDRAGRTDSALELEARRRFERAGVPLDRGQVPVRRRDGGFLHVDLGIRRICFGIEVDSMLAHSTRADLVTDTRRHNELMAAADDWRIVRVTWDLLEDHWADVLAQVRHVVADQARRHLGVPWPRPQDIER